MLNELGGRIAGAIKRMQQSAVLDSDVVNEMLKEIGNALIQADVNPRMVFTLKKSIKDAVDLDQLAAGLNKRKLLQKAVVDELIKLLNPGVEPFKPVKGRSNVIMFVGLQGSGKTTTCTKYAHYWKKKGWKVALVCADTFRAGAFDQLRQNATRVGIPFYGSYSETDPVKLAVDGVSLFKKERFDIIIVDTSGRHKQEVALFDEMEQVSSSVSPDDHVFILDASIGQSAYDQAKAFKERVAVGSVVITKLDGHAKGGGALSAVAATHAPIVFIGTGERFEDFEPFEVEAFVSRLLGFGDLPSFIRSIQDSGLDTEETTAAFEKLTHGEFSLRDLRDQFENLGKLNLTSMMSYLPGMQGLIPQGKEEEGRLRLHRFTVMMDSMTEKELDDPKLFQGPSASSRISRIARGSGTTVKEVGALLEEFKKLAKMGSKMKGLSGMSAAGLNPRSMQQIARNMDPRILSQMGGGANFNKMLSGLAKGMM
ncbi:hypothetical protein RCL1_000512 [Eukaryota sp. TZLM3-RCL]